MGRWRASFILSSIARIPRSINLCPNPKPFRHLNPLYARPDSKSRIRFFSVRGFSALPSASPMYINDSHSGVLNYDENYVMESQEDVETGKIPIRAYFLCTSIDLKSMHAENSSYVVPPTSRSSNYIALRFCNFPSETTGFRFEESMSSCCYMVVFQYGSAVLFNVEDHEVESYLELVRRHASGLLPEMRKDDYAVKERPLLVEDMLGGPDYIV
ncbi:hypothetical protein NMG60_11009286 [Bertholletia excelsa]